MAEDKYNGWLVSNSILKRSFAVIGHSFYAQLVIVGALIGLALLYTLLYWLIGLII